MLHFLRTLSLLLLLTLPLLASAADGFFTMTFGDFQEELQSARDSGKKAILIMFEMEECPFCHRMKQTILNQPEVQEYFGEHFLAFSVDIEGGIEITDFAGNQTTEKDFAFLQHRVRATPVFLFFDLEGEPIPGSRFTGISNGVEEFLLLGRFIAEAGYREGNFTRYKREQAGR